MCPGTKLDRSASLTAMSLKKKRIEGNFLRCLLFYDNDDGDKFYFYASLFIPNQMSVDWEETAKEEFGLYVCMHRG